MPLEFDKKKEVMRTQVKLECQQAGKGSFAAPLFWNSSLIALGLCVSSLIWEKEKYTWFFEAVCLYHLSVNVNKRKVNRGSTSNLSQHPNFVFLVTVLVFFRIDLVPV